MVPYSTDEFIEELVTATYGDSGSDRQKHVFRETLRGLVLLAKSEQLQAIKTDVRRATTPLMHDLHYHGEAE